MGVSIGAGLAIIGIFGGCGAGAYVTGDPAVFMAGVLATAALGFFGGFDSD